MHVLGGGTPSHFKALAVHVWCSMDHNHMHHVPQLEKLIPPLQYKSYRPAVTSLLILCSVPELD